MAIHATVVTTGASHGRVGPNSIIRVAEALEEHRDRDAVIALFRTAGLDHYLLAMPTEMVDEREVTRLQTALRSQLGLSEARAVAWDAGLRTGDYLLANRIPRPAQRILSILPPALASRSLIAAIRGNAWTFAGSGIFEADAHYPPKLRLTDAPVCRGAVADQPLCDYYAGTFERLFRRLVHRDAVVTEIACQASAAQSCVFEVRW